MGLRFRGLGFKVETGELGPQKAKKEALPPDKTRGLVETLFVS